MNEVQKYHANHSGRSPTGRLRNFGAMNNDKLHRVYNAVKAENNDRDALYKLEMTMKAKKMWNEGYRDCPADVDQDVWDTLAELAAL